MAEEHCSPLDIQEKEKRNLERPGPRYIPQRYIPGTNLPPSVHHLPIVYSVFNLLVVWLEQSLHDPPRKCPQVH